MNKFLYLFPLLFIFSISKAQNKYMIGFDFGPSRSIQNWTLEKYNLKYSSTNTLSGGVFGEKKINKQSSLFLKIGYLTKGFIDPIPSTIIAKRFALYNLFSDFNFKYSPFKGKVRFYGVLGTRIEYIMHFKDSFIQVNSFSDPYGGVSASGRIVGIYSPLILNFNRILVNYQLGIGLDIKELIYIQFLYSGGINPRINNSDIKITENAVQLTAGFNIFSFKRDKSKI